MEDVLTATIERERPRLWNFIRKRVGDQSDAEDIMQEVFHELLEADRLMQPVEQAGAWLFRVARNRIIDLFRKKKPEPLSDELEDLLPSPEAGPEAVYARSVLLDEIAVAVDELPEAQREVFIAHEVEGQSFKEIAACHRREREYTSVAETLCGAAPAWATSVHLRRVQWEGNMRKDFGSLACGSSCSRWSLWRLLVWW